MALGRTDGAPAPIDQASEWEVVFAEGTAFGNAAAESLTADLGTGTPQGDADGSSDGAGDAGSPSAPQTDATGDESPATSPEPADAPASASPELDPLAGAEPFTYQVGNDTRTIEGAYRLPGDGLYVPEDKVPQFQLLASRAETLEAQNRELYDRSQQWERLTSWQVRDAQGNPQTITGAPALLAQRESLARSVAFNREFGKITAGEVDPRDAIGVDAEGNVFWRQDWIDGMTERAKFAGEKSAFAEARNFDARSVPPPPPDAPLSAVAMPTIDQLISDHQISGLTAADKQFLAAQFAPYVTTTQSGRAVNPAFLEVMKDRAQLRADLVKAATTSKQTDTFNRGMDRGRQPTAPVRSTPPASPVPTGRNAPKVRTEPSANDMWASLTAEAQSA